MQFDIKLSKPRKGVYRTCDFFKWDDELIKDGT